MLSSAKSRVNYEKGIIYKLCCKDPAITECYVGSTTNFTNRKRGHKNTYNNEKLRAYNCYVYQFIRDNGGFENWDMIQVEEYKASSKKDLESRERHWIEQLKSQLNKVIPTRTDKQWREDNREYIAQKGKEYNKLNRDIIQQKDKEYYETNREVILQKQKDYYEKNKEIITQRRKEQREDNKEAIKQRNKKYYETNKQSIRQKLNEKGGEKIVCDICGSTFRKDSKSKHEKTQKHLKLSNLGIN